LRIKAFGRGSVAQPGNYSVDTIADYFINGAIPERKLGVDGFGTPGEVCDVDRMPWDDVAKTYTLSEHHRQDNVMLALQDAWIQSSSRR